MFPLLLVALLGGYPVPSSSSSPLQVGDAFVESLQSDQPAAAGSQFATPAARAHVNETLERFQCAETDHYHASVAEQNGDSATVIVDIDGIGVTALRRHLPLPRRWFLNVIRANGRWSIAEANTEEERIAKQLIATSGDAAREAIVEAHADYSRSAIGRAVAEASIDVFRHGGDRDAAYDAACFALRLVLPGDDTSAIVMALRAASIFTGSEKFASAALAHAERGDCDDLALALFTLGNYRSQVDLEEGARLLRQSASLMDAVDDPRVPMKALHNYAVQQQQRGAVPNAFDAALTLARGAARYGWREGEAAATYDLADTYVTLQRDDLALVCYRRALALLRADGNDAWMASALFDIARTEVRLGMVARSTADYREALSLGCPAVDLIRSLMMYASALAEAGRVGEAEEPLDAALRITTDNGVPMPLEIATVRLAQHREREAIAMAAKDTLRSQNEFFGDTTWRAETIIGRAHARLGEKAEAMAALRRAIDVIERRRAALPADELARQRYFTSRLAPYYALVDVLIADGRPREALVVAEQVKARTLLDAMTFGRADLAHQPSPADAAREADAVAALAKLRDAHRIEKARRALDELRTELRWRYPAATLNASGIEPLRALETLPSGAAVVEYVVAPEAVFVFVVRDGIVRVKRLPTSRMAITRDVKSLHDAVASRRLDYATFANRVARSLLHPIEPWIAAAAHLYVVPDGALWQVPFQLLPDRNGQPLIVHHQIAYLPSIALAAHAHSHRALRNLLALGNPAAAGLPDAAQEVQTIAALYRPRADVYVGNAATGQRFLTGAPAYSVIHIAAHADVLDDWPMESSLLLSGRNVTADEILRTPLRCDLTVLAACNTAAGHVRDGEGVVGLSWALLGAGCGNAVVSQWSVDSEATMRLMIAFHRGYAAGLSPQAALRRAELAMLRHPADAHPFYWAPFIVIASRW